MLRYITCSIFCLSIMSGTGAANAGEFIAYRLSGWKEKHFEEPGKANEHLAAVKKLGCEAKIDNHDGHTDVVYRSTRWKSMEVASDKLAHQWENWMKKSGFETLHGHSANHGGDEHAGHEHGEKGHEGHNHAEHDHAGHDHAPGQAEEVAYRLIEWKSMRNEDPGELAELVAMMNGLGCEIRTESRSSISIRCRQWKHVEVPSHKEADAWQAWLKSSGFEVTHDHS